MLGLMGWLLVQKWLLAWIVAGAPAFALSWLVVRRWWKWWATVALVVVCVPLGAALSAGGAAAVLFIAAHTGWEPFPARELVGWMVGVIGWGVSWAVIAAFLARIIIKANEPEPWDERQRI